MDTLVHTAVGKPDHTLGSVIPQSRARVVLAGNTVGGERGGGGGGGERTTLEQAEKMEREREREREREKIIKYSTQSVLFLLTL